MLSRGMLPQGDSLDKRISKETYELAREKTQELGLDISAFKQLKPWFFAMTLTVVKLQTLGFNPQDGLLYAAEESDHVMFRINPASGVVVSKFDYFPNEARPYFDGLAFIPEPATLSLLAVCGLVMIHPHKTVRKK